MSEKTRALLFLDRLTPAEKERLENDLALGVFDWREYLERRPSNRFVRFLDASDMHTNTDN